MSLAVDPQLYREYDEPPYDSPQPKLYAPAAPFGEAITAWLERQTRIAGGPLAYGTRPNGGGQCSIAGITVLADMAGVPSRSLWAWVTGDRAHIEQNCADRLALALDIPLCLLADEFKPLREWRKA